MKHINKNKIFGIIIGIVFFMAACEKYIKYNLNPKEIFVSKNTLPLMVQVAKFSDKRERIERERTTRKKENYKDLGDYTYDWEFRGNIAEGITKNIVDHLSYSKIFSRIWYAPLLSEKISGTELDSLSQRGVNAVMIGEIENFYAYYDKNWRRQSFYSIAALLTYYVITWNLREEEIEKSVFTGRYRFEEWDLLAIFPSYFLGIFLDSRHKRNIEFHTKLRVRLIDTTSHKIFWEDSFSLSGKMFRRKKSIFEDKFKIVLNSLRETINKMADSLSKIELQEKKNESFTLNQKECLKLILVSNNEQNLFISND